ncbi:ComF family protein [Salinisphaera sp. Q1T1-3]|uniref:ComF family protein n=1 Tax=Salinisphaera sp. Q1T1-3 TaxID=2321229 RepID=UPI000E7070EE|nr:ComF family protein [Salinisphaera sp. Q1T1-3]RJS94327.1 ComF family protein [Salinisphaera sp. Q1T1-3]
MTIKIDEWLKSAQNALLPSACLLCHDPTVPPGRLCAPCRAELPWLGRACRHCALPLAPAAETETCADCRRAPRFDAAAAVGHYSGTLRWLIIGLKFRARLSHAEALAELLAGRLASQGLATPDLLIPVPLHVTSFQRRGFNQAERIAARLASRLGTTVERDAAWRTRATARQSELDASARAANVRDAFACRIDLSGRHVAIVDDVLTTTRTAAALARALRAAGATRIDCYSVARA